MTTRHAIVIGGTSGIGLETARMLLEDGMAVTVWGSSPTPSRIVLGGILA